MLRILKFALVLSAGFGLGFIGALFSTWTTVCEFSREKADYQIINAPNGDVLKVPTHTDAWSFSAHSEPYRPSPVVDLFNKDGKP